MRKVQRLQPKIKFIQKPRGDMRKIIWYNIGRTCEHVVNMCARVDNMFARIDNTFARTTNIVPFFYMSPLGFRKNLFFG